MAGVVPAAIFFLLNLSTAGQFFMIAVPSFFGWCVADFVATLLSRPRLQNLTPAAAVREWEHGRTDDIP